MRILVGMDRSVSEHLLSVSLGPNAHVLLAECLHLGGDISVFLSSVTSQHEHRKRCDSRRVD